jgi:hypothetical protein
MTIVNLTPHALTVRTTDGDITIPPAAPAARVAVSTTPDGAVDGIPVTLTR